MGRRLLELPERHASARSRHHPALDTNVVHGAHLVSVTLSDNRESEIADALRSVAQHVDRVILVDTGITDRTIQRARAVAGSKLEVVTHRWVDYATARNAALDAARAAGATWILIVDSDERIDFGTIDLRAALKAARADILTVPSADDDYDKPRFVRAKAAVYFHGPTHEAPLGGLHGPLAGVVFDELPKTNEVLARKFTRDVDVLLDFIAENEGDPRWWFYLGRSLEGLGKKVRAAEAYRRCVELRRVGDEAAWAAFRQADILYQLGRHEESIAAAARGLGANPLFAECAWVAAIAALKIGRREQAVVWARTAEAAGLYNGCGTQRSFFRYPPALYELPYDVLRFALPDEEGREKANQDYRTALHSRFGVSSDLELDRLSVSRAAPWSKREEARSLLRPERIHTTCPSVRFTPIDFKPPKGWHAMNPSICVHGGELWCVVRTVNYWVKGRKYGVNDPDGITRTENYLGRFRRDGRLTRMHKMRDLDRSPRQPSKVVGYEDVRLASVDGQLFGSATVHDRGGVQVAALRIESGNVVGATVQRTERVEKNWMPFERNGKLAWVYSLDSTVVLPAGTKRKCPFAIGHLRGGAIAEFDRGYLAVTHEAVDEVDGRIYLHRFVQLNAKLVVTAVSPAFIFAHYGIEFAAGLIVDGGKVVVSFGIEDKEAWIMRVDVGEVERMLGSLRGSAAKALK